MSEAVKKAMQESNVAPADTNNIEELKAKYGKIYSLGVSMELDDDTTETVELIFKKPSTASYERFMKKAPEGMVKALKNLLYDNVIPEHVKKLEEVFEQYPGAGASLGDRLLATIGATKDVSLKSL